MSQTQFKASGQTTRYKTGVATLWKDVHLIIGPKSIDGFGYSYFNRAKVRFFIFGDVTSRSDNEVQISFIKVHPDLNTRVTYNGTLQSKTLYLTSHVSSGSLRISSY